MSFEIVYSPAAVSDLDRVWDGRVRSPAGKAEKERQRKK